MPHEVTDADVKNALGVAAAYGRKSGTANMADEYESAAMVGLAEAANSFDPARGVKFWTHALNRVRGAVLDCVRQWEPKGYGRGSRVIAKRDGVAWSGVKVRSIDELHDDGKGGAPTAIKDILDDGTEAVGWEAEWHDEIDRHARRLPRTMSPAFRAYHGQNPTMAAAGRMVGISESRVSQCLDAAHSLLADHHKNTERLTPMSLAPLVTRDPAESERRYGDCPGCGKPRHPYRGRCYTCNPGGPSKAAPVIAPDRPMVTLAPMPEPTPPKVTPKAAPAKPATDTAAKPGGLTVAMLRQFAASLAVLSDEDARWAVETAYRESRV